MRLICGLMRLDGGDADEALLRRMVAQMDVPRLKPGLGIWREGPVALAALDFAARGETLAQAGAAVIAADVRLDEPQPPGAQDARLLAQLDALPDVMGDFAFACWDRQRQTLTCGRDIFGLRPFSYVHKPGKFFAFASLPGALHGSGVVPKVVDQDALARRMVHAFRADDSLVVGIKRLPAAHVMDVTRAGLSLRRYWHPDRAAIGTRRITPDDAARELRRLVDQAVACRLPPGAQIGAHLSGGLDSSSLAVLAARRLREDGRTLHAYSFLDRPRSDITLEDETEFVQAVLGQEGDIDWTPIRRPSGMRVADRAMDVDKMTPLSGDHPESQVCARAEQQGVRLILSGWGGDEAATFNGRGTGSELLMRGHWRSLLREMKALSRVRGWSLPRAFYVDVVSYLTPAPLVNLAKRMNGKSGGVIDLFPRFLSAQACARLVPDEGLRMAPDGRENRWRLITGAHITERAEVWAMTGARNGLAFAFPLLDRRVVEFALSLPSALFLRGGIRRRAFRDAMADVLPQKVRERHAKYTPFPGGMIDLAEGREEFSARLDAYEKNEAVSRFIDLSHLRRQLATFPSPEQARREMHNNERPKATPQMIAVVRAFRAARYIEIHGSQDHKTPGDGG